MYSLGLHTKLGLQQLVKKLLSQLQQKLLTTIIVTGQLITSMHIWCYMQMRQT